MSRSSFLVRGALGCAALFGAALSVRGADQPVEVPRPIPVTRPEMKQLLESLKQRPLRIPLPELTNADRAELGERADSYEARLRYHYIPKTEPSMFGGSRGPATPAGGAASTPVRDFTRNADENMTLSYAFKTRLFWIVSRTNNCQYCLGHQEQKLSAVGMTDDEIAALDAKWDRFDPKEQAAFAFTRRITYEPHLFGDADFAALKKHYADEQILEMTMSTAWNNAINRWKEGAGIPQSKDGSNFFRRATNLPPDRPVPNESFLTPTSADAASAPSKVATYVLDITSGLPKAIANRPPLESRADAEKALAAAATRTPRLPLRSAEETRKAFDGKVTVPEKVPHWMRLLATFPNEGAGRAAALVGLTENRGDLSPLLKAQVAWIVARQDRAWYATGQARARLRELGWSDDRIYTLDGDWKEFTAAERALFNCAKHLAATPIALVDADVATALKETGPREVVQLVNFTTTRAYLDRVTEVAGLPLED
jgi:AhpD family alkylhydroperoxidase